MNGPIGRPLTLGTVVGTSINSTQFTDISALYFDTDAGFDITELTTGEMKISMNSTFKYWDLSDAIPVNATNASTTGLIAHGLDTMNFVAGNNIDIELYTTGSGNDTINYFKISAEPDYSSTNLIAGSGLNVTGGDASINNNLFVNGDVSMNSKLFVNGDVSMNSRLFVNGDVSLNSKLFVAKDVSLNAHLYVKDDTNLDSKLIVTNDVSLNSKLFVAQDVSMNAQLYVKDDTILDSKLIVTNDASLNSKLYVADDVSLNAQLYVKDDTNLDSKLIVTNDASLNSKLYVADDVSLNAQLYVKDDVNLDSKLIVTNDVSLNSKLFVNSDVSLNSKLYVNGQTIFNNRVDICGNLYAQYPPGSIPKSAIISGTSGSDTYVNNRSQSFYDVITQQPNTFTKDTSTYANGYSNTTKIITVYWNYDDILAKISNSSELAYLNFDTSYKHILPNIDKIYIDVSYGNTTNGWARYNTINVSSNYNTSGYKSVTFTKNETAPSGIASVTNVLSNVVNFDVRIYGENSAANYPTVDNRAIIYQQIAFRGANPPGQPVFISSNINSYQQATLTYKFSEPEIGDASSSGVLNQSQTKYTQSDTLCSTSYSLDGTILTDIETDDHVTGGSNFTVVLTTLRAGTKYNFLTRINNDIITQYSITDNSWSSVPSIDVPFDSHGPTQYTTLPSSDVYTSTGPSTLTYANTNYITTSSLSNSNVIYVNIGNSGTLTPTVTTSQSFEITDPSAVNTNTYGYGKWVDNLTNLVQVKVSVDNSINQVLSYSGFTPSNGTKTGTATISTSTTGVNYFSSPTQTDIYTDSQRKGFRLYGTTVMSTIANANIRTAIGQPRSTPYAVKLDVLRDTTNVGGTATVSVTSNVYVDDLSLNPTVTSTNTPIVTSVVWTMGIPSVKKYKIDCARTYNNINSTAGFIRGDRKLSSVTGVTSSSNSTNSTGFTTGTISILQSAIQNTGTYVYDASGFSTSTSSTLQSLHYTTAHTSSTTLTISETVYSLKTGNTGVSNDTTLTANHHFDKNSYNNYGTSLSTKLSLTDIYEITRSTSYINNDIGSLAVTAYTDHTTIVQNWTLLYYGGKYQSPTLVSYPNVTSYEWNSLSGNYTYNAGAVGLDLSGSAVSTGQRYKWIAFKLNKISATQYSFNSTLYTVKTNSESVKFLSIKNMLSDTGLFNSTTVSALFDNTNTNAIGFCRSTKIGTSIKVIGNFKQIFDPLSGNWTQFGTAATGYTNSVSGPYGSQVTNTDGDYGIYIDPTALNDDLFLFIGLNNLSSV
jgi:predicted acyltransferase (DUF342 family)